MKKDQYSDFFWGEAIALPCLLGMLPLAFPVVIMIFLVADFWDNLLAQESEVQRIYLRYQR